MNALASLYGSTIGKKAVMAVTGLIIFGFTIGHMAGNLLVFLGPDAINSYAEGLHHNAPLLWGTRITLLFAIPLHAWSAIALVRRSAAARPSRYKHHKAQAATYASRTMKYGGFILLAFIVYHILHYTLHVPNPEFAALVDDQGRHDVYTMVVTGFSNPVVVGAYLIAMASLGLHLSHGAWSMLQTLGLNHPKYNALRKTAAVTLAVLLIAGFSSVPIAVITGIVS
ncbi:MAG: succinate dehydrogenase cytochrome b subunit [Alphaproteobacteria bacterium]|nr:succinate dehydrogenase cytochrome b subunit [Alphaproteobacteria bacterium]